MGRCLRLSLLISSRGRVSTYVDLRIFNMNEKDTRKSSTILSLMARTAAYVGRHSHQYLGTFHSCTITSLTTTDRSKLDNFVQGIFVLLRPSLEGLCDCREFASLTLLFLKCYTRCFFSSSSYTRIGLFLSLLPRRVGTYLLARLLISRSLILALGTFHRYFLAYIETVTLP